MLFNNRYEIDVSIDGVPLDDFPVNYKFTMFDSIYNLYSKAKFTYNDFSGQFQELLVLVNGTKFNIKIGNKNETNECPYVVVKNSEPYIPVQSRIGGSVELRLVNEYYYKQTKQSNAYNDEISNIVKTKVSRANYFSGIDIETTANRGLWYQPLMSDQDFFTKILSPHTISSSQNKTPYYMFIDSNNVFNMKSYKTMFEQTPVDTLTLSSMGLESGLLNNTILKINFMQESNLKIEELLHRNLLRFQEDGTLLKEEDFLTDYPNAEDLPIPVKKDISLITGNLELYDDDVLLTQETLSSNRAIKNNSMKNGFALEKLVVTLNINPKIVSGKTVTVNLPNGIDTQNSQLSLRYSGKYLIESSYKIWDGKTALTIAILSRQTVNTPSTYRYSKSILRKKKS